MNCFWRVIDQGGIVLEICFGSLVFHEREKTPKKFEPIGKNILESISKIRGEYLKLK